MVYGAAGPAEEGRGHDWQRGLIDAALRACESTIRVVHILVGDGINTNQNAARRMLCSWTEAFEGRERLDHSIVVVNCASHQSNLVVMTAICGGLVRDLVECNALCGTCVRLCKYLLAD